MRVSRLDGDALFAWAVKALAGRAHSAGELKEKLRRRALDLADVERTLARLKDYGYLNDQAYAESYAASRLENQGLGARRILRDLRERRVAPAVAARSVQKVYEKVDEEGLIEHFLRRKCRFSDLQDQKELASAYRRLLRAGFTPGISVAVLKRFARNPELLDGLEPVEPDED